MDFEYTPEQLQLRKSVREFAEAEIAPHVMEWDEAQTFPSDVIRKLGGLGYMGSIFPEELGGAGFGYIEYCIIIEELSRVDGSVGIILAAHTSLCSNHIFKMGTDQQRRCYIPKLASGEWLGCWSLTEPEAGSDAAGTRTTAVLNEQGLWVLNGAKTFTTNAHYADVCVAMAVTDRAAAQHGISAFVIEKGTAGFRAGKKENKLGLRASATGEVIFENCLVPPTHLLGKQNDGFVDSLKVLDGGRISIAALGIGMAQGAYDAALRYSKTRRQFHRPISEFQAIQHKLVDMAVELDAARLLNYRAAWMMDRGRRVTRESAMAKLFASEAAVRIANEAVQIHGGYGFIKDYPVEKFYRDVKLCTIGEGTSEIQRLVIARQLLQS
ncbi:MAG: acyl-CoA dehydrogenase [Terriglobia bacterium]|nr:MAG: acyl-CoA dehydrogenase [Terriglobia bacterium]